MVLDLKHESRNASCLPEYYLSPVPPLLPFISDEYLSLILPIILYWAYGIFFHWLDTNNYLSKYRLHSTAELESRNRISKTQVISYVLFYQALTFVFGVLLIGEGDVTGDEDYQIALWALRSKGAREYLATKRTGTRLHLLDFSNLLMIFLQYS